MQRAKQKWIVRRAGATVEPLQNVRSIGFVAKFGETSLLATDVGSVSVANGEPIEVLTCKEDISAEIRTSLGTVNGLVEARK